MLLIFVFFYVKSKKNHVNMCEILSNCVNFQFMALFHKIFILCG
jgi:hypothetical protein